MADPDRIDLTEARELLHRRRQRLLDRRAAHDRDRDELAETRAIEASEAARADDIRDQLATLSEAERNQLMAIDNAFARIESGEYGICIDCGEPIDPARLRAMPEAERCVMDAEEWVTEGRMAPDRRTSTDPAPGHRVPARRPGIDEF